MLKIKYVKCKHVFDAEKVDPSEYQVSPSCVRAEVRCPYCRRLTVKWIKK